MFRWEASAAWDERFSNDVERRIEHSFERAERRLEAVERQLEDRFEQVEAGLEHFGIEAELRFEEAGRGFQNLETAFERVGASFERMGARFERLFENFEWRVDGWFGGSAEPLGVPSRITVTRVVPIRYRVSRPTVATTRARIAAGDSQKKSGRRPLVHVHTVGSG